MKLFTEKEATEMICPHKNDFKYCNPKKCMGWIEVYEKYERENHSGAKQMLREEWIKNPKRKSPRLEGPDNSSGYIILDAVGYCGLNFYMKGE